MTPPLQAIQARLAALRAWAAQQPQAVRVGGGVAFLALVWLLVAPPLGEVRRLGEERAGLRGALGDAEQILSRFRRGEASVLPDVEKAPEVLHRLEALARSREVHLIEMSPGQARPAGAGQPVLLPLEIQAEGEYRSLGEFLGDLRQFEAAAIFVRSIRVGREEQRLPRLRAQLSLEVAFSSRADES